MIACPWCFRCCLGTWSTHSALTDTFSFLLPHCTLWFMKRNLLHYIWACLNSLQPPSILHEMLFDDWGSEALFWRIPQSTAREMNLRNSQSFEETIRMRRPNWRWQFFIVFPTIGSRDKVLLRAEECLEKKIRGAKWCHKKAMYIDWAAFGPQCGALRWCMAICADVMGCRWW